MIAMNIEPGPEYQAPTPGAFPPSAGDAACVETDLNMRQLVTFMLGDEQFGLDIAHIREINRLMRITPVPRAPVSVQGVINLRGQVVPVVDLRAQFRLPARPHDRRTRIVVVELEGISIGFIVDEVSEVIRLPESAIDPPPPMVGNLEARYLSGVGKFGDRLLIILDLPHLVAGAGTIDQKNI
jgi:purine-binding chemotaxis protein CheW